VGKETKGDDETQRFLNALKHPLRRRILQSVAGQTEPLSPSRASSLYRAHLSNVSYHFQVLVRDGLIELACTRPGARGAVEHFYRPVPSALNHPLVKVALDEKEAEQ
jgi:DNA-binding transcriptional ArsR family regulator